MAEADAGSEGQQLDKPVVDQQGGGAPDLGSQEAQKSQGDETLLDEDREPGGSDPQAVRARKEYRQRKRLEAQLAEERQARLERDARLKVLEELRHERTTDKKKVYTPQELQTAVDAGTLTVVEAANYLAEQRANETAERVLNQERTKNAEEFRQAQAQEKVNQYTNLAPWILDKSDRRYQNLLNEYNALTDPNGVYRMPPGSVTDLMVCERVLGPLNALKKRAELDNDDRRNTGTPHTESGSGGAGAVGNSNSAAKGGKTDLSKVPKHFHDFWEKSQTPQAEREKEAALYFKRAGAQKK